MESIVLLVGFALIVFLCVRVRVRVCMEVGMRLTMATPCAPPAPAAPPRLAAERSPGLEKERMKRSTFLMLYGLYLHACPFVILRTCARVCVR